MRRRRWIAGVVLGGTMLLGPVLVAGCTAGGGKTDSAARGSSGGSAASAASAAGAAAPRAGDGFAPAKGASTSAPLVDGAAKIRTAEMTVGVPRGQVPAAADRAGSIALDVGGEIDADDRTSGRDATASLRLRVPPEALPAVLTRLSGLGKEISRQSSTTDVTEKVADVDSRAASARRAIARLRTLYAQATKVADVIAVESELSSREADLESLEAQQRALARQISMATVTLTLQTRAPAAAPPRPHRGGFVGGLQRGWAGFVAAAAWVATAVGTVLPFALLLALLTGAVLLLRRRNPTPTP